MLIDDGWWWWWWFGECWIVRCECHIDIKEDEKLKKDEIKKLKN